MEKFSLFQMRQEGLRKWHVREVFDAIPVFLLLALLLFLSGLIEFVSGFTNAVSIPVIVMTCIPIAFVILTTTLPSMQVIFASVFSGSSSNRHPPPQCPYKSTQSRLVLRFLTLSSTIFLILALPMLFISSAIWLPVNSVLWRILKRPTFERRRHFGIRFFLGRRWYTRQYENLFQFWRSSSWMAFDKKWLRFRSLYMVSVDRLGYPGLYWSDISHVPLSAYDCTRGVLEIQARIVSALSDIGRVANTQAQDALLYNLYHGVKDIITCMATEADTYAICIQDLLYQPKQIDASCLPVSRVFERTFTSPLRDVMIEETLFVFLYQVPHTLRGVLLNHFFELRCRLLSYPLRMYSLPNHRVQGGRLPPYLNEQLSWSSRRLPDFEPLPDDIQRQHTLISRTLFSLICDEHIPGKILSNSCLTSIKPFLIFDTDNSQSEEEIAPLLGDLANVLRKHAHHDDDRRRLQTRYDVLFYASALYLKSSIKNSLPTLGVSPLNSYEESVFRLIESLRLYFQQRAAKIDKDIGRRLGVPMLPPLGKVEGSWWSFLAYV
ncbi:hypothetical protein CPC08DRAFT_820578 [Agrocybe pediades]|nr:hypothetical protein CPC08DRAFT_820578 [Agrocybe pediades]